MIRGIRGHVNWYQIGNEAYYIPKISKFYVESNLVYVSTHQQITFSMLNRFCQLSKTRPPPQFLVDIIMLEEYQAKLNESTHLFYIVFQVLKVLLIFSFIIQSPVLSVLIVLHQFLHQQMSFFTTF